MRTFIVALAVAALSQGISAQKASSVPLTDAQFVMKAAQGGQLEAAAGRIGAGKAANDVVKAFAQRMVLDHSTAIDELGQLAATKKITVKPAGSVSALALDKYASGAEFDLLFMQQVVRIHEYALDLFDGESQNGKDAEVKAWAESKLPILREHLREAREIYSKAYRVAYALKQARR